MRFILAAFFVLPITAQPPAEGTVINALTGAPVKNATLRLRFMYPVTGPHTVLNSSTNSDADGRFLFDTIDDGSYELRVERAGFVDFNYVGLLRVPVKNLVIKLTPQGLIAGRVFDDDGEPVPNAMVEVMQRRFVDGKRTLDRVNDDNTKGDGGYAVGGLAPGLYYVRVSHRREEQDDVEPGRRNEVRQAFELATFPSAIDVVAGTQIRGIDMQLKRMRVFRVSGIVKGDSDKVVRLAQPDGPPIELEAEVEEGRFEFRDVLPGTYELQSGMRDQGSTLRGFTTVTVRDEDVKGVILTPSASPTVAGRFIFQGTQNAAPRCTMLFDGELTRPNPDGTFVSHPSPRVFTLDPNCYPIENYVKSITLNGQQVNDRRIDLTSGTAFTLEILLSTNGAHIGGAVPPDATVQVCDAHDVCVTHKGTISPQGFAPGDYRVFAWADEMDNVISSPEFRAKFESQSVKVKLTENSSENVDLTVISKEAMAIEAAKIP